jgi:peptide/nickel transport system substrate-binding protein
MLASSSGVPESLIRSANFAQDAISSLPLTRPMGGDDDGTARLRSVGVHDAGLVPALSMAWGVHRADNRTRIESTMALTTRRMLLASTALFASGVARARAADGPGDKIRPLVMLSKPQANDPSMYQAAQLAVQQWKKLGVNISLQVMSNAEQNAVVWNQRDKWDATTWEMVGRPERSDPDELIYSLFNSSLAQNGYDFVGYVNPDYDRLAQAQRQELDRDKRQALVKQAQDLITHDQPYLYMVYPRRSAAFNATVWDPASIKVEAGIGIRNFWTFLAAAPLTDKKDMVLNCHVEIDYINPVRMDVIGSWVTDLVWDKLTRVGLDGDPVPWACTSFKWTGDTTMEVVVRDGMMFHDGTPVTMEDVVYSFQLPAHKDKTPQFFPFVSNIEKVEQTGPQTILFTLKAPQASFPTTTLSKINIVPKHVWEPLLASMQGKPDMLENYNELAHVGSGPFKFAHWRQNEEVMLERFDKHWTPPKLERWIMRIVPNQEATLGMLKTGEINFLAIFTGDPRVLAAVPEKTPAIKVVTETDLGFQFLAYNNRRPPFDDVAFRRALSLAVSRPLLVAAAYNGFAVPAGSCVSTALPFWHANESLMAGGDLAAARKTLADAGYTWEGDALHYPPGKKETLAAG